MVMKRRVIVILLSVFLGGSVFLNIKLNQSMEIMRVVSGLQEIKLGMCEESQLEAENVIEESKFTIAQLEFNNQDLNTNVENLEEDIDYWQIEARHWESEYEKLEEYGGLKKFSSIQDLSGWLDSNHTEMHSYSSKYDCDDFALELVRAAREDGYLVGLYMEDDHVMNFSVIGNSIYIIEPQTDETYFWGEVD